MITYFKTNETPDDKGKCEIEYHNSHLNMSFQAKYDRSIDERIYTVYSSSDISSYLAPYGTKINKIEAHLLTKELQPDRKINGDDFSLNIMDSLDEAKQIKISEFETTTYIVLASVGVEYDNQTFSRSINAITKWNLMLSTYQAGIITDESEDQLVSLLNEKSYSIPCSDITAFCTAINNSARPVFKSQAELKNSVMTIDDSGSFEDSLTLLLNVIDNRMGE